MDPLLLPLLRCPRSGASLELEPLDLADDGTVRHGLLTAGAFSYPIVSGIPLLMVGYDDVTELVRTGHFAEATALGALRDVARSPVAGLIDELSRLRGVGRVATRVAQLRRDRRVAIDTRLLFGDPPAERVIGDPLRLAFLDRSAPIEEGYLYFTYRFGTPRYLVALALIDALPPASGPVVDVGCGAGHLAWALTERTSGPVVGVDPSLAQLLAAREIAPDATFVCGDGMALPLRSGSFERVLSSDVLPYVTEKATVVGEMTRLLTDDGALVLTALRNAGQRHVHGGEPLTAETWARLPEGLPHRRLLGDDSILDRYLSRCAPGDLGPATATGSQTVSVVAARRPIELGSGRWDRWPHAIGPLAPHPLLRQVGAGPDGAHYQRCYPSSTFAEDNRRIDDYLPESCTIPPGYADPDRGASIGVAALIDRMALLGQPAGMAHRPDRST